MFKLSRWKCHKVVRAGRIVSAEFNEATHQWVVDTSDGPTMCLPMHTRITGNNPIGGYVVEYDDGHLSWSPAAAFEAGYTQISGTGAYVPAPGHQYALAGGQTLQFLDKRQGATPEDPLVLARDGTTNEEVIDALIDRLTTMNAPPWSCRENSLAITKLEEAKMWLESRRARREKAKTYGTGTPA